ncbi:MAG: uracil-DNA glycosylase family protein [Planctomycetota bacterium]
MPRPTKTAQALIDAARELSAACDRFSFTEPVTHVYNPMAYAWPMHQQYLMRFGRSRKRVLMLGMNPGPWGMAQTGVPFGEVAAVRDWMGITHKLDQPPVVDPAASSLAVVRTGGSSGGHPKRPILGLDSPRSEVSGRRVWELMQQRFGPPEAFFKDHFVTNYCPLVFMEASGKNRTPDKLPAEERTPLETACNLHLHTLVDILRPTYIVGVGKFAERKANAVLTGPRRPIITTILHPSPASPLANRGWATQVTAQLIAAKIWD